LHRDSTGCAACSCRPIPEIVAKPSAIRESRCGEYEWENSGDCNPEYFHYSNSYENYKDARIPV
jgi:hypothetical protein